MPREKETYRDVLARIAGRANELYPGRMIFNKKQCAAILGVPKQTIYQSRRYQFLSLANTLEDIASLLPEHNRLDDNTGREAALENFA